MVHDKISEINKYLTKEQYEKIKRFLSVVSENMEEGQYDIDDNNIYARVMSYNTSHAEELKIEAHNIYIDVQVSLIGTEGIEIYEREVMNQVTDYDLDKDVQFYETDKTPDAFLVNRPGYFTLIYPEEAHKPQISADGCCALVKKYVIKIRL